MLTVLFAAKGSPGVTSSALALAAVWPRPVVLIEADPSGSDLVYRCRSASGGPPAMTPNLLGLASAVRGDHTTPVTGWTQRLGCGVDLVPGVTTLTQGRGIAALWPAVAQAVSSADTDVIVDLGRIDRASVTLPLLMAAHARVPVAYAGLDSLMHTRELLKDLILDGGARTMPLLIGRSRTSVADREDVDEVLAAADVIAAPAMFLPLDSTGLSALQDGANPAGRGRGSVLVRGARTVAEHLVAAGAVDAEAAR